MQTKLAFMLVRRAALSLLLLALNSRVSTAQAAPGDLDATFAGAGKVRIGFGGGHAEAYAAAVQPDGKLILAGYGNGNSFSGGKQQLPGGDFLLARLDTNNLLDVSFGNGGKVITKVSTNYPNAASSVLRAAAVQADGKIVAAGYSYQITNYTDFTLVRYNPDGSVDTTFGTNGTGIVSTDFGGQSQINAMLIESGSNILVAGSVSNSYALARYTINGVLDTTFNGTGKVVTSGSSDSGAFDAVLEAEGEIIAAGSGKSAAGYPAFAVVVYTTNGALNLNFDGLARGVFTQVAPNSTDYSEAAAALAVQPGNGTFGNPDKLVVAGTSVTYDGSGLHAFQTVLRYLFNGDPDPTLGGSGFITNQVVPPLRGVSGLHRSDGPRPRKSAAQAHHQWLWVRWDELGLFTGALQHQRDAGHHF